MRSWILIAAMATGLAAHATETKDAASPTEAAQEATALVPVFDCFRMNSAWGFALSGTVIDQQGMIHRYSMRGKTWSPDPVHADGATYYSQAQLRAKYANAKPAGSVDAKALAENTALILAAADGKLERTDTGARDAGSSTCHAYIHDEAQQRYRDVELGSDGGVADVRVSNSAAQAQTLLAWLKSVDVAK